MRLLKKKTRKYQESGSSGHNDDNFSDFNEYDDVSGHISFYIIFLLFG